MRKYSLCPYCIQMKGNGLCDRCQRLEQIRNTYRRTQAHHDRRGERRPAKGAGGTSDTHDLWSRASG